MQSEWRRLHPASLIFTLGSAAKGLLLPGIAVLVASRGRNVEVWLMLLFVPAALVAVVRYATYRYRMGPEELMVRHGILTRNERHIPYDRIQNIDIFQNPLHRMLGVAEARVETASGDKPEAVIRVLSLAAVSTLRERVFRDRRQDAAAEGETLLRMPLREIVLLGLISNRGMALVAAAMGVFWQFGRFGEDELERRMDAFPSLLREAGDLVPAQGPLATVLLALMALLAALVALRLLSVAWSSVKFYGFALRMRGEDLRAEYGLLPRISATIPRGRIQLLSIHGRPLHRWCRRAVVQVETAGGGEGGEDGGVSRLWLAPLIKDTEVASLVARVLPEVAYADADWKPIPFRAWRRVFRRGLVPVAILAAAAAVVLKLWALPLLFGGTALAWLHARRSVRRMAWAVDGHAVLYRSGYWARRISIVRFGKVQVLSLRETPWDRRAGMAALTVDTAGAGRVRHRVEIPFLDRGVASELTEMLSREAGRTAFQW